MAARPKTLPAAIVPVLVGAAYAWRDGAAHGLAFAVCLVFALLVQIGTNYANDTFDFLKGADREDRVGPQRAVGSGLISPEAMLIATIGVFLLAFCVGLILVVWRGPVLLVIGVTSILFGFAYTGGPFPLAYRGLGDVFVLIFFGLVAVGGTYFVLAGRVTGEILIAAVPIGLLATNILVVNNFRDMESDTRAEKRTLVVRFGRRYARWQYGLSLLVVFLVPIGFALEQQNVTLLLPLLAAPLGVSVLKRLTPDRPALELNPLLGASAVVLLVYGILQTIAVGASG